MSMIKFWEFRKQLHTILLINYSFHCKANVSIISSDTAWINKGAKKPAFGRLLFSDALMTVLLRQCFSWQCFYDSTSNNEETCTCTIWSVVLEVLWCIIIRPKSASIVNGHPLSLMAKVAKTAGTSFGGILGTVCQSLCVLFMSWCCICSVLLEIDKECQWCMHNAKGVSTYYKWNSPSLMPEAFPLHIGGVYELGQRLCNCETVESSELVFWIWVQWSYLWADCRILWMAERYEIVQEKKTLSDW